MDATIKPTPSPLPVLNSTSIGKLEQILKWYSLMS